MKNSDKLYKPFYSCNFDIAAQQNRALCMVLMKSYRGQHYKGKHNNILKIKIEVNSNAVTDVTFIK
jgi:hypothetical protein